MGIKQLKDVTELDELLGGELVLLYKHSPGCWISAWSMRQVERFAKGAPAISVYLIDVVGQRDLSGEIAERLGVQHASPQVILLRQGRATWHASHFEITAGALRSETAKP
ncbi:MAG: bacillithiol system redox-active protein YtxJ [Gemmatimonadales bacterium]|nr:bacillithiol system redox-active protein YtxJ [Gemmatimonadales bacterium]NIN49116.1 bacillithiol system redox-active protein YtxJ [Gemmatimonadales bacterium]NIP06580.1 bacillithiol system redox-active protein YtxJ [Gemmatimonadales bacterium]NIR00277.1 bacillithiol system redox-active protein YtxJ [Gemmatimonadales bacterium]NIS64610.1 bacillithiol system redox-active protein YtxJ [Gemmatimonadales bacterium]